MRQECMAYLLGYVLINIQRMRMLCSEITFLVILTHITIILNSCSNYRSEGNGQTCMLIIHINFHELEHKLHKPISSTTNYGYITPYWIMIIINYILSTTCSPRMNIPFSSTLVVISQIMRQFISMLTILLSHDLSVRSSSCCRILWMWCTTCTKHMWIEILHETQKDFWELYDALG